MNIGYNMKNNIPCSCDICEFGESHDYLPNQYWCRSKIANGVGTIYLERNCKYGTIDDRKYEWKLKFGNR